MPTICDDQTSISGSAPMYFLIVYVIYFCTMGATLVPYEALGAELTPVSAPRTFCQLCLLTVRTRSLRGMRTAPT